jgi:TRAP-type uncharacterized transport system fused permease subunit
MTCVGMFAFASATMGWFAVKNRWYEYPLLLAVAALMFRPGYFAHYLGIDNHYLSYLVGLALWGAIYALQRFRTGFGKQKPLAA